MFIDFTSLNKACPEDVYPLPRICQIVDSAATSELLSFLDSYSDYHQINMSIEDEEKLAFIMLFNVLCYTKMSFGLKNAGATYQKCVHIILEPQIGRNIKAYINDIIVKSKMHGDLLDDISETFGNLHKFPMKLNTKKCVFGVFLRKLLGYMVSISGIVANPKRVEAIEQLRSPQTWCEIQKLAGMMAALNQFISKLGKHDMPFYKMLRKAAGF
jgi:hypothetical protein